MITQQEFITQVRQQIFPLIDIRAEWCSKLRRPTIILGSLALYVFLMYCLNGNPVITLLILLIPFAGFYALDHFYRKQKAVVRPLIFRILGADTRPEYQIAGPTIEQLRQIHFLPKLDARRMDEIADDNFGFPGDSIPFYVQEIHFSEGGDEPDHFSGALIRFPSGTYPDLNLMVLNKESLLYKDQIALSSRKTFQFIFGSDDWQPLNLESVNFTKKYYSFTNNQLTARRILTPLFMERIRELEAVYNAPVNILFFQGYLCLMIVTNRNMFEFSGSWKDIKTYEKFYDEIAALYDFQHFFNLS